VSRFTPCELKAMASESDMGCPLRIIVLVKGYRQGGRSPIRKAQNDLLLVSNVGCPLGGGIVQILL
jgi:hypothetical protein